MFFSKPTGDKFVNNLDINEGAFATGDLTKDNAWHELNFSGKLPVRAKSIRLRIQIQCTADSGLISFRVKGESYEYNIYRSWVQIANKRVSETYDIPIATDGIIEYKISNLTWTEVIITVMGWHIR